MFFLRAIYIAILKFIERDDLALFGGNKCRIIGAIDHRWNASAKTLLPLPRGGYVFAGVCRRLFVCSQNNKVIKMIEIFREC